MNVLWKTKKKSSRSIYQVSFLNCMLTFLIPIFTEPVKITTSHSKKINVDIGKQKVKLPCRAEGSGNVKVFWRKIYFELSATPKVESILII